MKEEVNKRNNILLKALAGSAWGMEKKILLTTHQAFSKSVLNYCAPIWTPTLSQTNWNGLQTAQNSALRTALGCVKMTSIDHLHSEAKLMPVKEHNDMLSKQFLLSNMKQQQPNHGDITNKPRRLMKKTLVSEYSAAIRPLATQLQRRHQNHSHQLRQGDRRQQGPRCTCPQSPSL